MIIFDILGWIAEVFIFLYVVADLISAIRNAKYQKLWNKGKATRVKIDPNISRADLCELYVTFCKKNGCKVEF